MDERLKWLEVRISSSLRPRNEDLKNMFLNDENRLAFYEFINNEDVRRMFVFIRPPRQITASLLPPHDLKYKSVFFLKCNAGTKITKENIGNEVFYIDCTDVPLEHLELVVREVYLPLLCTNQGNLAASGGDKVMDVLHRLMSIVEVSQGHVEGRIILSLPSIEVLAEAAAAPNRRGAVLHVLETTVLGWIKQIKGVLRHDPIADLFHHFGPEPGPLDEIKMWERQLARLHSILNQLESPVAKDILQNLEQAQSQYASSFHHVRKDVNKAVAETNRTLKFLSTMQWLFEELHNTFEPSEMLRLFKPLMQVLYLVWQNSVYYHQMDKFYNLLRLLSNEVVHRAIALVGEDILREPLESYSKLKDALRVCAAFRGTYLDFKDKADDQNAQNIAENAERLASRPQGTLFLTKMYGPHAFTPRYGLRHSDGQSSSTSLSDDELWTDSPWPPRNAPCFDLLNSFMERCNDVLELVETTRHFRLLAGAAEVGGAGSMSLDALVKEIHEKYSAAMNTFFSVVDNVLSIDGTQNFERAFFTFRTVVKSLEKRLAEILRLSYNQCPTVDSQLRLLEVFEGISGREMVQEQLKDKDSQLIRAFTEELLQVRNMFDDRQGNPPQHANMPPVVSRLMWVKALKERIKRPMEKLRRVSPHSLEGDSGWQMRDAFNELIKSLDGYEDKYTTEWKDNITAELTLRLKQPLLIAEEYDEDVEIRPQAVHVNLDPQLLRILRETHYLGQGPFYIDLPDSAKELLRNTNSFELRVTATRLETIVSKYNTIMRTITEFEKPLFERKLSKIDTLFEQGLQQYTWKMKESADFIEQAMSLVCIDVHQNLDTVQTNCHEIAEITISWSKGTLDVFSARVADQSYSMEELLDMQKSLTEEHETLVIPSGNKIHLLVQSSFEAVQISQASPAWQDYIDYIDAIVLDGLKQATLTSLKSMLNNLVQANLSEEEMIVPVLTIRLELIDHRVSFRPPLDQTSSVISVQELVHQWLDGYLARGNLVKMLGPKGTYQDYIAADEEVKQLLADINRLVEENGEECKKLNDIFKDYAFLWLQDVNLTFQGFLKGNLSPNPLRSPNRTLAGNIRQIAVERSRASSRASSTSSIESAGIMGTAERTFLTPKNLQEDMPSNVPSLDEFDAEIEIYRTARDEVNSLNDFHNVGWLRVDLQPIKQVLTTYASKWMWTYTKYLSDQVTHMLQKLDEFLKRIEPEIESITGDERDTASFMKMMRLFNEVSAQQSEMDGRFNAMHRTVLLLKKYGQKLPESTQQLFNAAPGRWNNLKTKVSLAKQRLGPRIQEESVRITQDLEAFGHRVITLSRELENSDVYQRECNIGDAWVIIDNFVKRLTILENEAQDLIELQELLETSVVNFAVLPQCRHELNNLKQVWETVRVIDDQQTEWKRHRWQKMNTKFLREETNKQLDIVRALPEDVFTWDVYMGLHESITTIQTCLPLIDDLSNPAMRTRHWKQLVRCTGGALTIDNDTLKRMTLGELLSLGLQKHVDDVRGIVQRAVKDLSIEQSLKTYEEVWLSKIFELRLHSRNKTEPTDLPQADKESESQSEGGQSQQQLAVHSRSQGRTTSRISNQSSHSKNKRSSIASLPSSLLNLGEVIRDIGQLFLLTSTDPIFEELEHHQVSLQAMQSNSAAGSFLDEVLKWQKRLQNIEAVLSTWLEVQEKWVELEEVFSGADVRTSLSHDANRFAVVNRDFRLLMRATEKNPNVLQCCQRKNILPILEHMNHGLEQCRKSLLNHLERRRQIFPRFYFLSLEDVLHIICNGYDLNQVNIYISKMFENIGSLVFEEVEDNEKYSFMITGVLSSLGERLEFLQPVTCEGQIETWLTTFIQGVKGALQFQMATAMGTEKPKQRTRQIHSAGARKVTVPVRTSSSMSKNKVEKERNTSRASSRQTNKDKTKETSRPTSVADQMLPDSDRDPETSWTLDHVAEIVYLATQVKMNEQINDALAQLEEGNRDSLQEALDKINESIKATTMLLKGLSGEREAKSRKGRGESDGRSQRGEKEELSESASVAGARSSYTASMANQSRKGSTFDMAGFGLDTSRSPIPEEETSAKDSSLVEPQTLEPIDTMNILTAPTITSITKEEEEKKEETPVDNSEVKLMLFPSQIQKLSSLLALLAHLRDFIERMIENENAQLTSSFDWRSQLKYTFDKDNKSVPIKILDASFEYGYEYLGSVQREVITPLTERVFVALTQSINSHMGAMCVGPIESGKYELIQELSRCLGHPMYKFNCTNTMDYVQLQDIFRGMASTGCWICFNNINNIPPAVLSVFSQLISTVMEALRAGKAAVHLQSDDIQLNPSAACFATLDSAIKVRPGNPENLLMYPSATAALPDYVMVQFRTVSVIQPNLHLSLEVMLFSQGFVGGRELAKKTMTLYELCRKLLGTNVNISENITQGCDVAGCSGGWSMTTLKGVVEEAGASLEKMLSEFIEEEEKEDAEKHEQEEAEKENTQNDPLSEAKLRLEEKALVTSLRNTFLPRIEGRDASIFVTLVTDIWPHADVPMVFGGEQELLAKPPPSRGSSKASRVKTAKSVDSGRSLKESINLNTPVVPLAHAGADRYLVDHSQKQVLEDMHDAIAVATGDLGLLPGVAFQSRVAQLSQLNSAHQTIFVVGPPGCGKSECIKTFAVAERERGKTISVQSIFTKAVESDELMGYLDPKIKEWKDGLLASILRKFCVQPASANYSLQLKPVMKIVQLDGEADPSQMELLGAVLNNNGTVVLGNNERICIPSILRFVWEMDNLEHMSPGMLANVGILSMTMADVGWKLMLVQWLEKRADVDKELLTGFCDVYIEKTIDYLTQCTTPHMFTGNKAGIPQYKRVVPHTVENMVSTFCTLVEALVASLPDLSDVEFERYFNFAAIWAFGGTLDAEHRESFSNWWKEEFSQHIDYPEEGLVFDYVVDNESHEFTRWTDMIPSYSGDSNTGISSEAFVHTVPVEQLSYLLGVLSDYGKPVLFVGENGCGKTAIINDRIRTVCSGEVAEVLSLTVQANRFTNARLLYDRLDERLEWKHGRTFVPRGNKRLLCLVDDINLSQVDKYGHQTAIELVRQHIDDGGFYSEDTHAWRYVKNVTYVSTINPNSTANVPRLSQRFLRHFAVFGCPYPGTDDLQTIFSTLLQSHFIAPEMSSGVSAGQHHMHDEKDTTPGRWRKLSAIWNPVTSKQKAQALAKEEEESLRKALCLIVKVNVELQDRLRSMFLPTAQRCHYLFTMRDLGTIFKNLSLSLRPACSRKNLLLLWQHECFWVYGHRMVNDVDYRRFKQAFVTAVKKEFTSDEQIQLLIKTRQPLFSNLIEQDSGIVTAGMIDMRHSSSVSEEDAKTDIYRPAFKMKGVKDLMSKGVEEYNKIHPRIKLALYTSVVEQVCRITRTIASPHEIAHSVLIAEGCPGRCTVIVKLAAHLCGYTVYQINPSSLGATAEYKMEQFKTDLVQGYTRAGSKGEKILLLLHEEELLEEDFLVFLIEFIVSGSISHLFSYEDQTTIINSIRTEVTQAGLTYTRDTAWNFFLKTVRNNFRICLIAGDGGRNFQRRCREYPAFTKNVNFIWFPHWSKAQLVDHAQYHLQGVKWMTDIQRENIAHMLASMHLVLRQQDGQEKDAGEYRHITNTSYEKFVERYISLASARHNDVEEVQLSVTKSLNQIRKENEVATKLRKQLEHELIVLEERKMSTIRILTQIGQDTAITEQQIKVVKAQLDRISKLKKTSKLLERMRKLLPEYQVAHERAVYKAIAIVGDTKRVVQNMSIDKLAELRAMGKPIIDIEDLMTAVIMILKSPSADLTWQKGAKRQMANLERFIEELMSFDDNQLPEATLNLVEPYLKKPSFDPDILEKKTGNSACGALCKWVRGVVRYHRMMISKVKPLHQKVDATTQAVDEAEHRMATLESKRKEHEGRLSDLARRFEDATIDKNEQDDKTIKMKKMLETAAQLRKILKGERQRCQQIYDSYERRLVATAGGCSMAAAFCTYLGPYHHNFRRVMLTVYWPNCLRERGVPLVIDSIDGLKGRVIDWSIDFLKTASGASTVYDIDYTSALLNIQEGEEPEPGEQTARSQYEDEKEEEELQDKDEIVEPQEKTEEKEEKEQDGEKEDTGEEKQDEPEKSEKEAEKEGEEERDQESPKPENSKDKSDAKGNEKALDRIQEEGSEDNDDKESQVTTSSAPMLTSMQYNRYVVSLIKLLVGERTLNDWLKKDFGPRQIENAAILCSSWQRPPMMIDPNGEGATWLAKLNRLTNKRKLVSLDMETRTDPHVILTLEKCIMNGKPVLLRNCEEHIDNIITPLMHHRNTSIEIDTAEDPRMIRFCGRRVLCNQGFRFYLSTPLPKPKFNPEIASSTTLINFGVSHDTLTEDLLSRAFARIRPELYKERNIALRNMQLQKDTLLRLSDIVKEKVLTNQEAMLGSAKALKFITDITNAKIELANRLNETSNLLDDLDTLKDELYPLARRAAMLYSILRSLQSIHNEYQFSLRYFIELFDEAVGGEIPVDFWEEEEGGYDVDDESTEADPKARAGSVTSHGSKESATGAATGGTTDKQESKKDKGEGDYEADFEADGSRPPSQPQGTEAESASTSAANKLIAGEESEELPPLELPETATLPSEGVQYSSLSANQIKQVMDRLTGLVYRRIRQSLYEEDCLLFATLLCLNIEAEGMESFTNEEMSLLLQGNPGLGMQLTLADFDCKDDPPDFLPQEKWEDILALSVLPGPLDSLCVNFAQNADAWKEWYKSDHPENEPLPLSPTAEANPSTENRPGSGGSRKSAGGDKSPDLGPLSDFHQLLLLRMLRPDRLPVALARYVNKHLTLNLPEQSDFSLTEVIQDAKRHLGVLLLLPPCASNGNKYPAARLRLTQPPVEILRNMAKSIGVAIEHVRVGEGCEYLVDEAIDSAEKSDGWVIIEGLHLAPKGFYNDLKKHLVRCARSRDNAEEDKKKSRFCIWITTEPCVNIPDFLIRNLHKLAWNLLTGETESSTKGDDDVKDPPFAITFRSPNTFLHTAIVSTLKQCPQQALAKTSSEAQIIRMLTFGIGVIQGILVSRQLFGAQGLNQWYPFNKVQMEQAIDLLTGKVIRSGESEDPHLDILTGMISKLIYENSVLTESDKVYVDAIVRHVVKNLSQDSSGTLTLGGVSIPTPPANVDPVDFGSWYEKNVDEEFTLQALQLHSSVEKESNDAVAGVFIKNLDFMFETQNMEAGDLSRAPSEVVNISRLRSALDICMEELPNLLELGHIPDIVKDDYDFPYHRPSNLSLSSVSSSSMPESIGYVLLQECLWFNRILCHIRQEISVLQQSILSGPEAIFKSYLTTVYALQEEYVPISWIHPNCQPCTHSLVSWLDDLKKRHSQLHTWVKREMVPTFKDNGVDNPAIASGRLKTVWLGGLVNPRALLTALLQEKAIISECNIDEVYFESVVMDDINTSDYEVDEGGIFITDLHMYGGSWDYEKDCLKEANSSLYKIPYIYLRPKTSSEKDDKKIDLYPCPVYMNKSRQVQSCILNLNCPSPVDKWKLARTALVLDAGLPEDGIKKSRSYLLLMRAPHVIPAEDESDIQSEEEEELRELEAGEEITDTDANQSEQSQLSYRPMSPKAPPLPPGLGLMREDLMTGDDETRSDKKSSKESVAKSQGKGSKESLAKSQDGDKLQRASSKEGKATPKNQGSQRSINATPTQILSPKPGATPPPGVKTPVRERPSRPGTRASATSKRSKLSVHSKADMEEQNDDGNRPRSMHEDPITQMEIQDDGKKDDDKDSGAGTDRKPTSPEVPTKDSDDKAKSVKPRTPAEGPDPNVDLPSRPQSNASKKSLGQGSQGQQPQRTQSRQSRQSQRSIGNAQSKDKNNSGTPPPKAE